MEDFRMQFDRVIGGLEKRTRSFLRKKNELLLIMKPAMPFVDGT
jgi:hypothetical protein